MPLKKICSAKNGLIAAAVLLLVCLSVLLLPDLTPVSYTHLKLPTILLV